jgi:hypothetical protein
MIRFTALAFLALLAIGCGSDTVGSNPEMPPADQRKDDNKVQIGSTPETGGQATTTTG